jgi:hypothetical protein
VTAELCPAPSSSREAPFNVTIHDAKEGAKKRHKQHSQRITVAADHNDGNNEEAGSSGMGHVATTACSGKHQVHLPIDHFKRLLEEACSNHVYPIKHKIKDCSMMKNFMVSRSLTPGYGTR